MKRISMRLSDCTGEPEINQTCVSLEFYSYSPLFGAEWIQTIHAQIPEEIEKLFKDDSCQNLTSTVNASLHLPYYSSHFLFTDFPRTLLCVVI